MKRLFWILLILGAVLALDWELMHTTSAWPFFALFPDAVVSLFITGGHGGTEIQEMMGHFALVAVNTAFYWTLFVVVDYVIPRLRRRSSEAGPRD